MNALPDAWSLAVTSAEIAWPIILVMCFILILFPFVFLFLAKRGSDPDDPSA